MQRAEHNFRAFQERVDRSVARDRERIEESQRRFARSQQAMTDADQQRNPSGFGSHPYLPPPPLPRQHRHHDHFAPPAPHTAAPPHAGPSNYASDPRHGFGSNPTGGTASGPAFPFETSHTHYVASGGQCGFIHIANGLPFETAHQLFVASGGFCGYIRGGGHGGMGGMGPA